MRIHELFEEIDKTEAKKVYNALVVSNPLAAKHFLSTMNNPIHQTVDSAQSAAEQMARAELAKSPDAERIEIQKQLEKIRQQNARRDSEKDQTASKQAEKPKFKGANISLDKAKDAIRGPLGAVQKAWQRGTKFADTYTLARKS